MKPHLSFLIAAGLLAAAQPAHAMIERTIERSFTVQPGGSIAVSTAGGGISVEPSADGVVKIIAKERIRAGSEPDADEILRDLELSFEQQGNAVTASAKYDRPGFSWGSAQVVVDFIVTVPADFAASLRTSGGSISVGNLAGPLEAHTSGGNIALGRIGGAVDARTSGGSIDLEEGRGAIRLLTSGGHIVVEHAAGPAYLRTSGGGIRIGAADSTVQASSSGGDVRAGLHGPFKGDCVLRTSGGKVEVTVDPAAAFQLHAATSGGQVRTQGVAVTTAESTRRGSRLSGTVNGGGALLTLQSSGGDIDLRTF